MSEHQQTQQSKDPEPSSQRQITPVNQTSVSNPAFIIQRARTNPKSLTPADILQLQRTIGNRAVSRLLSEIRSPSAAQQATVQRQEIPEEEETLQTKRENNTGMPDNLKAGVENLSAIDMSDVRVHYNSDKPAQIGALAYTQGTDIHVASGQERHLPHEAWHVVQKAQGRVQPTFQMKGVAVNDDIGLEREADVMGSRAVEVRNNDYSVHNIMLNYKNDKCCDVKKMHMYTNNNLSIVQMQPWTWAEIALYFGIPLVVLVGLLAVFIGGRGRGGAVTIGGATTEGGGGEAATVRGRGGAGRGRGGAGRGRGGAGRGRGGAGRGRGGAGRGVGRAATVGVQPIVTTTNQPPQPRAEFASLAGWDQAHIVRLDSQFGRHPGFFNVQGWAQIAGALPNQERAVVALARIPHLSFADILRFVRTAGAAGAIVPLLQRWGFHGEVPRVVQTVRFVLTRRPNAPTDADLVSVLIYAHQFGWNADDVELAVEGRTYNSPTWANVLQHVPTFANYWMERHEGSTHGTMVACTNPPFDGIRGQGYRVELRINSGRVSHVEGCHTFRFFNFDYNNMQRHQGTGFSFYPTGTNITTILTALLSLQEVLDLADEAAYNQRSVQRRIVNNSFAVGIDYLGETQNNIRQTSLVQCYPVVIPNGITIAVCDLVAIGRLMGILQ